MEKDIRITLTDLAREKVTEALKGQTQKSHLRIEARANGTTQFSYSMRLVGEDDKGGDDIVVGDNPPVVVDSESAKNLNGATIDFEEGALRSGFRFDNPNKPEIPSIGSGERTDLEGSVAEKVQHLLDSELNAAVAAHGGRINLVGVKDNKVYLSFGGGCHGCGMVGMTLKHGVEARIRELIPEVAEVIDTTDHGTGQNPFYA